MSASKTPPAKRLKQSSMGDFFQKRSGDANVRLSSGSSTHESLNSMKELKLDDETKRKCKDTVIDIDDGCLNSGEASSAINCTTESSGAPDSPDMIRKDPHATSSDCVRHAVSASSDESEVASDGDAGQSQTAICCSIDEPLNTSKMVNKSQPVSPSVVKDDRAEEVVDVRERSGTTEESHSSSATIYDNKMDPLAERKDPKRFYSNSDRSSSGYTVMKCTSFHDREVPEVTSSATATNTTDESQAGHSSKDNTAHEFLSTIDKGRNARACQTRIPHFPINLDQTVGEIPPDMARFPQDVTWRTAALEDSSEHTVLVKGPFDPTSTSPCEAEPAELADRWDNHHVKMPYSEYSKYTDQDGTVVPRWDVIQRALLRRIHTFEDLREAILSYNGGYAWDLNELENVIEEMTSKDRNEFFNTLLPEMIRLALSLPEICTRPPPLLVQGHSHTITMSQRQVASLLANAFFCTFPRRNQSKPGSQYGSYPTINFHTLFNSCDKPKRRNCRKEKIKCILNYFRRVTTEMPLGNLTVTRTRFRCRVGWDESMAKFKNAFITSEGLIEDQGHGMLMVDFANSRVGGGVLRDGCVQEEILFVIYPELIVSRLFTEALDDDETLLMTGPERFNQYSGYSDDFRWCGNAIDIRERDSWGRRYTQIVAMDALAHRGKKQQREQFGIEKVMRELVKTPGFPRSAVATGNWGCGAFGGDACLKFLLQWMAASRAGRPLVYFTFGDHELMCKLRSMQELVAKQDMTIGVRVPFFERRVMTYKPMRYISLDVKSNSKDIEAVDNLHKPLKRILKILGCFFTYYLLVGALLLMFINEIILFAKDFY